METYDGADLEHPFHAACAPPDAVPARLTSWDAATVCEACSLPLGDDRRELNEADDQAPVHAGTDALARALYDLGAIPLATTCGGFLIDSDSAAAALVDRLAEHGWHIAVDPADCEHDSASGLPALVTIGLEPLLAGAARGSATHQVFRCDSCAAVLYWWTDGEGISHMVTL